MRTGVLLLFLAGILAADTRDNQIASWAGELGGHVQRAASGAITSIDLSYCWISDADLDALASLHDLQKIDLSLSLITDVGIQRLKTLENVTELNLYAVELITDTSMAYIRDWHKLQRLNLRGTDITDTTLEYLARIPSLRMLDISHTQVTNNGLEFLSALKGLEELAVGGNKITGAGLRILKLLPSLRVLSLTGEQKRNSGIWSVSLTDLDLNAISGLAQLQDLNLGGLKISDAGLARLNALKLSALDLSRTQISAKGLGALQLNQIKRLSLQAAKQVDDEAAEPLLKAAKLEVLDLSNTGFSDSGLAQLSRAKNLRYLFLNGTHVTEAGVESFRATHPDCLVSWTNVSRQ